MRQQKLVAPLSAAPFPNRRKTDFTSRLFGVPGCTGFAVGRTIFSDPLTRWAARKITMQAAATEIGQRYREFVNIFEKDLTATD